MKRIGNPFGRRLVTPLLLTLVLAGSATGWVSLKLLTPPLSRMLGQRAASDLVHSVEMSLTVCEERLDDLLSLRMEADPSVNNSMRRQALEEIKRISKTFVDIEIMVLQENHLVSSSIALPSDQLDFQQFERRNPTVFHARLGQKPIMACSRYFPFWRWHIVSFIFDKDFQAPIVLARRIVALGISGVVLVMIGIVFILFQRRINLPLKQLSAGARNVAGGRLEKVSVASQDEIGQVAEAFNVMVQALLDDKQMIRQMMSELRDSEERYRVLTEHALAHIAVIQGAHIVYANNKVLEDLGHDEQTLEKVPADSFVHPDDRPWVVETMNSIFKGERNGAHFECRYLDKSGRPLWFENLVTAIVYREKPAVVIHAIEIEKRKQEEARRLELEQKLSRAQKMEAIGALAGSVAHDLNNILGGLVTYPELLLMDLDNDSPLHRPLMMIHQAGQRAAAIVQDLLTLARRGVPAAEIIDLNQVISDYLASPEFGRLRSEYPRIELVQHLAPEQDNIIGSPVHLSKTVMNLVANAFEALSENGRVVIETFTMKLAKALEGYEIIPPGTYTVLKVEDNGVGIAPEDLKKIFEPFYTKKVMGRSGTGLGMAVVWSTVKDHDGFIDLQSRPGKGTSFQLYFPVTDRSRPQTKDQDDIDPLKGSETILVVDDVEQQRMVGRHLLERLGYKVLEAESGEKAVYMARDQVFDLLVLDMIMEPGIDGLETYRRILAINPGQKAIIASGYSETVRVKKALAMGAACYVRKPYTLQSLGRAVRQALDGPGPQQRT